MSSEWIPGPGQGRPRPELRPEWLPKTQRRLSLALGAVSVVLLLAHCEKGRLAPPADVRSELLQEPRQTPTPRAVFTFEFAGTAYRVRPVAEYDLWGLVVAHNNPQGFGDIYHDDTSVDTRDLCVVWGPNLEADDYRRVEYHAQAFECWWRSPPGVRFHPAAISNNHLITDSEAVRDTIATVHVGDQVHVRGALVDYQRVSQPEFWRRTSTIRQDDGPGACEVVFVDAIEVLARATPVWYLLAGLGWWIVGALVAAKLGLLLYEARQRYVG